MPVVEDEAVVRKLVERHLSKRGFFVAAGSLREADASLAERDFDAVLANLNLPAGKGVDAVEWITLRGRARSRLSSRAALE